MDKSDDTFLFRQNVEMSVKQILHKNNILQANSADANTFNRIHSDKNKHGRGHQFIKTKKIYDPSSMIMSSTMSNVHSGNTGNISSNINKSSTSSTKPEVLKFKPAVVADHKEKKLLLANDGKNIITNDEEEEQQSNQHVDSIVPLAIKKPEVFLHKKKNKKPHKKKVQTTKEDATLPSLNTAWFHNQFRCDKKFISTSLEPEIYKDNLDVKTSFDMFSHPIKEQIMYHVMSIRNTFRKMSAQSQAQMIEQVKVSCLEELKQIQNLSYSSSSSDGEDVEDILPLTTTSRNILLKETNHNGQQEKNSESSSLVLYPNKEQVHDAGVLEGKQSCSKISSKHNLAPTNKHQQGSEHMECWPLVIFEALEDITDVRKNESFVCIHRMQNVNYHCWVISTYDSKFIEKERYILYDDDVLAISSGDLNMNYDLFLATDLEATLVYSESINEDIKCSIHIHQLPHHLLYANITYSSLNNDEIIKQNLHVPIYEVISLLGLQNKCKLLNSKFWKSNNNGKIWKNIVSKINHCELIYNARDEEVGIRVACVYL